MYETRWYRTQIGQGNITLYLSRDQHYIVKASHKIKGTKNIVHCHYYNTFKIWNEIKDLHNTYHCKIDSYNRKQGDFSRWVTILSFHDINMIS